MKSEKTVELRITRSREQGDAKRFARRAREIQDRFIAEGRKFSDSVEDIRKDRDSR